MDGGSSTVSAPRGQKGEEEEACVLTRREEVWNGLSPSPGDKPSDGDPNKEPGGRTRTLTWLVPHLLIFRQVQEQRAGSPPRLTSASLLEHSAGWNGYGEGEKWKMLNMSGCREGKGGFAWIICLSCSMRFNSFLTLENQEISFLAKEVKETQNSQVVCSRWSS